MKERKKILIGIGIGLLMAFLLVLVFLLGFLIGSRQPGFFPFWEKRIVAPREFIPPRFGHGVVGIIDSIGENSLVVKERNGALKTVLIEENTVLRQNGTEIKFSDFKEGDQVIVIGEPEEKEGVIKAKVVRIITKFPTPGERRIPKL
ncbi:MAG: hypothetical protein ACPLKP_01915 [Microgenomates group bacterium]